ncbi:PLXNA [Mytilus coruscus]|uniref:PLXNA n=1 Tax=Mytilus coruscus TaxID=42192 RepID=A0A6J8AU28_MYTCO|nr:PLXNA [Mytilus coruscus]
MDGFKLYVTNTSTIPPDGYLCYEDPDPGLPNITQTIPCNQLGKYVIYYDIKGDEDYGPIVELCYVSINGCRKNLWGRNCTQPCSENCIENHFYPGNGSCIWGCKDINCLNDVCDKDTLICTEGCKGGRTGQYCNKYAKCFGDSKMTVTKCTPEIYKVDVGNIKAYIGDLQYKADSNILTITVGILTAALVTAVVTGVLAVVIIRKKKRRTTKEFRMELLTREEIIREASREEFADAQMSIRDIKSDLVTSRVPFCNYQTYILHQLFPNQDITTNILLQDLESHSGMQLFMLYKAVQTIVEMGPIDALTGNSKNTISEEKLLKMRIKHQTMTLQIDLNGNSDQHYPVNVLDCDTISQVKQKCCAQIYKNKPASEIPNSNELSLEWQEGRAGKLSLNDIDNTSERNSGLVSLNTLKHYMVTDNSRMALMYRQHDEEEACVNSSRFGTQSVRSEDIALLVQEKGDEEEPETHKWHLSNLPDDVKSTREVDYGDIFLNRLFQTKLLLADYIDSTFEGLVDQQSLSISIRYFFCMLDRFGKDYKIDSEVLQSWKIECYATQIWAPLIGKPDILFDVNVPGHVEPCLDILRQVVVESFTQTAHEVNKESPTQQLLFHKDKLRYRDLIDPFFTRVIPVTDKEFWSEIDEMSNKQKADLKFSRQSTLDQLYQLFIVKYRREIIDDLEDIEESKDLQFANKLEEVIDLIEETSSDS